MLGLFAGLIGGDDTAFVCQGHLNHVTVVSLNDILASPVISGTHVVCLRAPELIRGDKWDASILESRLLGELKLVLYSLDMLTDDTDLRTGYERTPISPEYFCP